MNKIITVCTIIVLAVSNILAIDVVKNNNNIVMSIDGKPRLEYRFADVPFKPYAAQLYTPNGVAVLRDAPHDHLHHHSLMFAIAADGIDFWAETPNCGKQIQKQIETGADSLTQQLEWRTVDGKAVLSEERTVKLLQNKDVTATLLTWHSRLQPATGKDEAKLTGSHYFGLGMRFVTSMDKVGTHMNSSGEPGELVRGDEHVGPAKWSAYSAPASDKPVTIAVFDHPSNLRHPARMFTMLTPFAYISATMGIWKEPYILKSSKPLDLCYGVALWDGTVDNNTIEQTYQQWVKLSNQL